LFRKSYLKATPLIENPEDDIHFNFRSFVNQRNHKFIVMILLSIVLLQTGFQDSLKVVALEVMISKLASKAGFSFLFPVLSRMTALSL
jgi:hypothetical protein